MRGIVFGSIVVFLTVGAAFAQVGGQPAPPSAVIPPSAIAATLGQPGVLAMANDAGGNVATRFIPVRFINLDALCAALGGYTIHLSLTRLPRGAPPLIPRPGGSIDRGAPLAPFVPREITDIIGIAY
jgi:hypothetical protein